MKSRNSLRFGSFVLVLLASLLSGSVASAQQGLCRFNANIGFGPVPPPRPPAVTPYFPWTARGLGDQTRVTGQHSGLVGWREVVDDVTFAQTTAVALANRDANGFNYTSSPLIFVFGECYGGGMIDDLAHAVIHNPMSIVSASFFNQPAEYPSRNGNGLDFVWAYIQAMTLFNNPTAWQLATRASNDDPFGWGVNPLPARNGEVRGTETPEYYSQNNGNLIPLGGWQRPRIVLWAGHPKDVDDRQLTNILFLFLHAGYQPNDIVVLYMSGKPKNSVVGNFMKANGFNATHLRAASQKQLDKTMNWAFPAGAANRSDLFFFLAADHGCNNAFQVMAKNGNGGDDIQDGGDFGSGDDDSDIY